MDNPHSLWMFFLIVLGTVLLPGLDMMYVISRALAGGIRDGLLAVAGIMTGALVHVIVGVLGVAAIVLVVPWAYNLLLCLGAAYIAYIGWSLLKGASQVGALEVVAATDRKSGARIFLMGMATNLLNPKAYLFMLAIFPQFFDPRLGHVVAQAGVLWLIAIVCQLVVYGGLALLAVRARGLLGSRPGVSQWLFRIVGVFLIGFAIWTAVRGIQGL